MTTSHIFYYLWKLHNLQTIKTLKRAKILRVGTTVFVDARMVKTLTNNLGSWINLFRIFFHLSLLFKIHAYFFIVKILRVRTKLFGDASMLKTCMTNCSENCMICVICVIYPIFACQPTILGKVFGTR